MLNLSADPRTADQQIRAIIFYLTTFGHIDGQFDASERRFVENFIERLVCEHVSSLEGSASDTERAELVRSHTVHFMAAFREIDAEVEELFAEAVAHHEAHDAFVYSKLKLRCFEIFEQFDRVAQEQLLSCIDELLLSDGEAHPAELKFRGELAALLEADFEVTLIEERLKPKVTIHPPIELPVAEHVLTPLDELEHPYSLDPAVLHRQIGVDRQILDRVIEQLARAREEGAGKLLGKRTIGELRGYGAFLDGHVAVWPARPGRRYDLTVLGDLHGCYSCLKAAVVQARFFEKLVAYQADPERHPEPKLLFLGDYLDRGRYGINGVLRGVLWLYLQAPEHVLMLRGNHEYFVEHQGEILGGVKPSESVDGLKPHVVSDVLRAYMSLFEALPTMLFFGPVLFVHGGLPRDESIRERLRDLSDLNDEELRFEMLWSDPSRADVIPAALQEGASRFSFGRLQAQRFLQRVGCAAMVRGHQRVATGFLKVYDEPTVCTLFSSGGPRNRDLPESSSYREVTPMALTVTYEQGEAHLTPWPIAYEPFNQPERNGFYRSPPTPSFSC